MGVFRPSHCLRTDLTQPTDRTSPERQEATPADTLPMPNNRNAIIKNAPFFWKHAINTLYVSHSLSFLHVSSGNPVCHGYKSFAATYCPRNTRKDAKEFRYFRVFSWAKSFAGSYPRLHECPVANGSWLLPATMKFMDGNHPRHSSRNRCATDGEETRW